MVILSTSYSQEGHSITFVGKVIKVTTGSVMALTEINCPMPTAIVTPPSSITLTEFFNDLQYPNIRYVWKGKNGNIFSGIAIVNNNGPGTNIQITGGYTISADGATMHNWDTIIRTDGTSFPFDFSWAFEE